MKTIAIYTRVSTEQQDTASQRPDLERWAAGQSLPIVWYTDTYSGTTMNRPGWRKLEEAIRTGKVATVACWRLDRLGRTASGLTALFDDLQRQKINLISLKEGLDLTTPAGRMMATVLAGVAQFESEVRAERVRAGQAVARAAGKRWGGSKPGVRKKVTPEIERAIRQLFAAGEPKTVIARTVQLSRPTIDSVLRPKEPVCA